MKLHAFLLAGGIGARLAPLSTPERPKQFVSLFKNKKNLFSITLDRALDLTSLDEIAVLSSFDLYPHIKKEGHVLPDKIFLEPRRKNTLPPIALATWRVFQENPHDIVLFLPSDHYIHDGELASSILKKASQLESLKTDLIVFGVPPDSPNCHYGYIEIAEPVVTHHPEYPVLSFTEKPTRDVAQHYLATHRYLWNSGIFMWKASVFLNTLKQVQPALYKLLLDCDSPEKEQDYYDLAPLISIDYGVMEKIKNVTVVPFNVGWSDCGTWESLKNLKEKFQVELSDEVENHFKHQSHNK